MNDPLFSKHYLAESPIHPTELPVLQYFENDFDCEYYQLIIVEEFYESNIVAKGQSTVPSCLNALEHATILHHNFQETIK